MKNYKKSGSTLALVLAAVVAAGAPFQIGRIHAVAQTAGGVGDTIEGVREGVFINMPKKPAEAVAVGDLCYWDPANSYYTKTKAAGMTLVGAFAAAALAADVTCEVLLDGVIRPAEA